MKGSVSVLSNSFHFTCLHTVKHRMAEYSDNGEGSSENQACVVCSFLREHLAPNTWTCHPHAILLHVTFLGSGRDWMLAVCSHE